MDDLSQPGSRELRLVLPASVEAQLRLRQGGGQEGAADQLHQPIGHFLNHFLQHAGFMHRQQRGDRELKGIMFGAE